MIAIFDMSAPLRGLSWGNSGHSEIFFGKTSSAGESSEGREVIVIEAEKEIGEVIRGEGSSSAGGLFNRKLAFAEGKRY